MPRKPRRVGTPTAKPPRPPHPGARRQIEKTTPPHLLRCAIPGCVHPLGPDNPLELDHRVPRHRGGTNDPDNLRWLCRHHNRRRTYTDTADDPYTGRHIIGR